MKLHIFKISIRSLLAAAAIVAGFATSVFAQEVMNGNFAFGPATGTTRPTNSDTVSLRVPARTNVSVGVLLQRSPTRPDGLPVINDIPVTIQVFRPDGTTAATANPSASVFAAGVPVPSIPLIGGTSQRGCPDTWRVRISTPNVPAVRIFGTLVFTIIRPGQVKLNIDELSVDRSGTGTRSITAHSIIGAAPGNLIAGTGTFRIRARWHTDPLDLANMGRFFRLNVELIKPDGSTLANSENGFSNHGSLTPPVDFTYAVTPQDAAMTGNWRVRVTNPGTNAGRIVGFDLEKNVDLLAPTAPFFNSTFQAGCTQAVGVVQ